MAGRTRGLCLPVDLTASGLDVTDAEGLAKAQQAIRTVSRWLERRCDNNLLPVRQTFNLPQKAKQYWQGPFLQAPRGIDGEITIQSRANKWVDPTDYSGDYHFLPEGEPPYTGIELRKPGSGLLTITGSTGDWEYEDEFSIDAHTAADSGKRTIQFDTAPSGLAVGMTLALEPSPRAGLAEWVEVTKIETDTPADGNVTLTVWAELYGSSAVETPATATVVDSPAREVAILLCNRLFARRQAPFGAVDVDRVFDQFAFQLMDPFKLRTAA